ncbi:MAG: CHAT domain-containing protein [Pyrinomonadaceae bacterium]
MERKELAARLVTINATQRAALLRENSASVDVALAYALKDICYEAWTTEPTFATSAAAALRTLDEMTDDREINALAAWVTGIAALTNGQMEQAVTHLDEAQARFNELDKPHSAAATQVSKLYALALLGRYDEAIACGMSAREIFVAHQDTLATGKIEHNIGNIFWRRDRYREAEHHLRAARECFINVGDQKHLASIENCLAYICSLQQDFRAAEQLYAQALARAKGDGLIATQAGIEASMGNLALFQGRYDRALDYLERSRRKYAKLGMPHQTVIAEQEIADAYLELNLAPEAAEIYARIIPKLDELGMRAEQAHALIRRGRALILLGEMKQAHASLAEARTLYAAEGNIVGEALTRLTDAQLSYAENNFADTIALAQEAEAPLEAAGAWRHLLMARWLRGEALRAHGQKDLARDVLNVARQDAEEHEQPQIAHRCHTSLGLLAASVGDFKLAEESFKRAVEIIENLRAPLPAEEFRTAFVADKLTPYDELMRLCLEDTHVNRISEAFCYAERARSRALVDMLGGVLKFRPQESRDRFESELLEKLDALREELNWFYNQLNRATENQTTPNAALAPDATTLNEAVREREHAILDITRQLQHRHSVAIPHSETIDFAQFQSELADDTTLIEYTSLDGELLAFIVTNKSIEVVRRLATEFDITATLAQFRFQIEAMRYGAGQMRKHLTSLVVRARHHLCALYDSLLRPLEAHLKTGRLVVVPHRALHYVPFHALDDGTNYAVERWEISYAPSAIVLQHCQQKSSRPLQNAVLIGVADAQTPRVRDEVRQLAPMFETSITLLDEQATRRAVEEHAPRADVLHLACHGQFRPDNPLFSSLRLTDGWLTVRDTYNLNLNDCLVTLSACETGMSAVAPGDELLGLARGFLSAGASSLVLSLWAVDDDATAELMIEFYARLRAGESPSKALRAVQLDMLKRQPHPFFWSPFIVVGRG